MEELLFTEYKVLVKNTLDKYMTNYKVKYPETRNFDSAKEFMDENYDSYRKEIAGICVDMMHVAGIGDKPAIIKIINQNKISIGALFGEIMNDAIDN